MGTINCPFKSKIMEILAAFPILQLFKKKIIRIYFIIYLLINLWNGCICNYLFDFFIPPRLKVQSVKADLWLNDIN